MNPELWIAAAGQIFYSLSLGFGTICTYASYVRKNRDIALASLTANAANEVVEVGIAGMMIVPAAVSLLGVVAAAGASTFGLGFNVLPQVFAAMPMGQIFGTLFFFLLFLAAITSSISQARGCCRSPLGGRGLTGPSRTVSATRGATQQLPPTLPFPRPIPAVWSWARHTPSLSSGCLCPSAPVQPRWGQLPAEGK